MYQGPSSHDVVGTYQSGPSRGLGIALIVIGVLAMVFNGVALAYNDVRADIGHGFWCGALLIVTGVFGIVVAKVGTRFWIAVLMVLQLVSAFLSIAMTGVSITALVYYGRLAPEFKRICLDQCATVIVPLAMESMLAILGLWAFIDTLIGSQRCYRAISSSATVNVVGPSGGVQVVHVVGAASSGIQQADHRQSTPAAWNS